MSEAFQELEISSDNRDAVQDLKEAAENKEFDILLVFMFDRRAGVMMKHRL